MTLQNDLHAESIARGERAALASSSVEFIEKASGIQQRYVIDKAGVLDPTRMRPRFAPRPDEQMSLMAEIAVDAARQALASAGKQGSDVDAVLCAASNMQRAYPAMAVEIQQAIGAGGYGFRHERGVFVGHVCPGAGRQRVRCGTASCVLIVNPRSPRPTWNGATATGHFIFGDVCTALIVEAADAATAAQPWECWAPVWSRSSRTTSATTRAS